MTYARQDVVIHTKITDEAVIANMGKPIIDFVDKHGVYFDLGYGADGSIVATYQTEGLTTAYCKGMMAEVKQMLKDIYKCKIDVIFSAY